MQPTTQVIMEWPFVHRKLLIKEQTMTKWEYLYAKAEGDKILEVNGEEVGAFEGVPIGGVEQPDVSEFLGKSGQEGWEVAGISPANENASSWRLVLKRPVA
jgi:hypothetical protein